MRRFLLALLIAPPLLAGQAVLFDGQWITPDPKYSYENFENTDLSDRTDMDGIAIYAASFAQDTLKNPFPAGMTGVHFYNCNLCNVDVPAGNFVHDFFHNSGCGQ